MNPMNWKGVLVAAFIPLVIRMIWYHPKALGGVWTRAAGMPEERPKWASMPLLYGLSLLFAFFLATVLMPMVIHQIHIFSLAQADPEMGKEGSKIMLWLKAYMAENGSKFRSPGHGALHGAIAGLFFATPLIATNALFEWKGWRYILVHSGFWILSMTLMGAVICGWV